MYDTFRPAPYVEGGCQGPEPGERLGAEPVWLSDGSRMALGELVDRVTVVETGSTTCPLYRGDVGRMRKVANAHPEVAFLVLYTREAHPGGRRGPHTGLADKMAAASKLPQQAGEWRRIVVDGIEGQLHRRLSGAPDATLILDADATVLAWMHDTEPGAVSDALHAVLKGHRLPAGAPAFRPPPPRAVVGALLRGGFKAVWDFMLGSPTLVRYRLSGGASC